MNPQFSRPVTEDAGRIVNAVTHPLAEAFLPDKRATGTRRTAAKNWCKMSAARGGTSPMKLLLAAHAGLFADAFSGSLAKLGRRLEVEQCEPEHLPDHLKERNPGNGLGLVLIDADAVPGRAAKLVEKCHERLADVPVVALASSLDKDFIAALMKAGAQAYLPKSYSETQALGVLKVVLEGTSLQARAERAPGRASARDPEGMDAGQSRRAHSNPYGLTGRELEVLTGVCQGRQNLNIAKRLGITEGTVKIHLSNSYKKLGVENRAQAIRIVERLEQVQNMAIGDAEQGGSLRDWLLPHMSHESHRRGEVLFKKGDPAGTLYFIQQGTVTLPEIDKQLADGALLGEMGIFLPEHTRTCSARCETDAQLFCLTAERAQRLFFENPQFAYHVMQLIAGRLRDDQTRPH